MDTTAREQTEDQAGAEAGKQAGPERARRPWLAWSTAGLVLSVLVGASVGVGGYTFHYAKGTSYLSNDPAACANCHVMREQYDGWHKSRHHAVATCNDCHVPQGLVGKYTTKAAQGYRHSTAFTFGNFHEPIAITAEDLAIVEDNCRRCHSAMVAEINSGRPTREGALSAGHGQEASCTHCHHGMGH